MSHQQFYETVARQEEYMDNIKSARSMRTVTEYAKEVGKPERTIRHQCVKQKLMAQKIGSQWIVFGEFLKGESK